MIDRSAMTISESGVVFSITKAPFFVSRYPRNCMLWPFLNAEFVVVLLCGM